MSDDRFLSIEARLDLLDEKIDRVLDLVEKFSDVGRTLAAKLDELNERLTYREKILVGWKEIGEYLGLHEQSAYNLGREPVDPIPFDRDHRGNVVAQATALDAWKMRRARRVDGNRSEGAKTAAATRAGRAGRSATGDPS